jgi:hypothetical protein
VTRRQQHAVPGGGSALKPPPREQPPPPPARPSVTDEEPVAVAPERVTAEELPPPPPAVRRHPREQLNTKIRVDMRQRLNAFVTRHDSTLQGVLEAALDEYMARRGWSWEDYQRTNRRR